MAKQKRETMTEEQIFNIQKKMEEAKQKPIEKRVYTKKETVLRLKKHILEMQKKGYTLDDIRLFFEKNGLVISLSSLKSYLGNTGTRKAKKIEKIEGAVAADSERQNSTKKDIKKAEEKPENTIKNTAEKSLKVDTQNDQAVANDGYFIPRRDTLNLGG